MIHYNLACTEDMQCTQEKSSEITFARIVMPAILAVSIIGLICNYFWYVFLGQSFNKLENSPLRSVIFFSIHAFSRIPSKNLRFLQVLQIYTINSFLLNLNDMTSFILYFSLNKTEWLFKSFRYYDSAYVTYFVYVYAPVWVVLYTFGGSISFTSLYLIPTSLKLYSPKGTLDSFIVYTRIQMLYPRLKFLSKTSIYVVSLFIFIFSVVINVPINLSRTIVKTPFQIGSNSTSVLATYGD